MTSNNGRKQPAPELGAEAAQLRELTRAAHEAVRDLRTATAEARRVLGQCERAIEDTAMLATLAGQRAGTAQWEDYTARLQRAMDVYTSELAGTVDKAREHIVAALTISRLIPDLDNEALIIEWGTANFTPSDGGPGHTITVVSDL